MFSYADRVLNFGHRGAREAAPENTLSSFRQALEFGADGVELDVMLSKDEEVVVIHDHTVDRTTSGTGRVSELTLAELKRLDAGKWFDPRFEGERIPTLEEVIATVGQELLLNIEIKNTFLSDGALETKVVQLIEQYGLEDRVIISSFNPLALRRVKGLHPSLHVGLLFERKLPLFLRRAWLAPWAHADALHPHYAMINSEHVRRAKRKGYRLNVWTVNERMDMENLIALGVDSIITDRPDLLANLLSTMMTPGR